MRSCFLILFFVAAIILPPQQAVAAPVAHEGTFIHDLEIEGFLLGDKEQFIKLFKPYRNKYLLAADMDSILHQIQDIYDEGGYQSLVSIQYRVVKKSLIYTVSLVE